MTRTQAPVPQQGDDIRSALRFAVPWRTRIAVVAAPGETLPDMGRSRPVEALDPVPAAAFAERLSALREQGCEYLLVPAAWRALLDQKEVATQLAAVATPVAATDDGPAIFSLHPSPAEPAGDGLPLPPGHLIRVTSGCLNQALNNPLRLYDSYLARGAEGAACIRSALSRFEMEIEQFEAILDFGCGCGRMIRQWHSLPAGRLHGCDYNPLLVRWCSDNLPIAEFRQSEFDPPLPYEDEQFDFLYAISIFTHLDVGQQVPWMRELTRVMKPGGVLLVTVGGSSRAERQLDGAELDRFHAGELVVMRADLAGTNACAAFHPERYLRETLAADLELVGLIPDGANDVRQDQVLLRKAG